MRQRKKMIMKTMAAGEGACISVPNQPREQSGMRMEHQPHSPEGQMRMALVALVQTHSSPYHC